MGEKLLSIVIPTYNRKSHLETCLSYVCSQMNDEVDIYVIDNKSTNYDFPSFIGPYTELYGVKAIQNDFNIGLEGNILRAFEVCKTEWLWILGDDDNLKPNIIAYVLDVLRENNNVQFVKFNSPYNKVVKGLRGYSECMRGLYDFSNSFFISEGIHNIRYLRNDLSKLYSFASTCIPQALYLIDMCIVKPETEFCFIKKTILQDHGQDVTWSHIKLVPYLLAVFDLFRNERQTLQDNVFRNLAFICWMYVRESNLSLSTKWYYYRQIVSKYGRLNMLKYNFIIIIKHYLAPIVCKRNK